VFGLGFQDSATPIMEGIIDLHNYIFFYLILIFIFVFHIFASILEDFFFMLRYPQTEDDLTSLRSEMFAIKNVTHFSTLEVVWTILPGVILMLIAVPSFALLYAMDEVLNPAITFKAIGHQWFWSYEFSDYAENHNINYDSNMLYENQLAKGEFRLLTVDQPVVLPINTHIRVIITSMDVLHSWAVPSLGVKVDGCPGRLNQAFIYLKREGVFYGQCSELCGVSHGYMPIVVKGVSLEEYSKWLSK
jgi:cytochrome c oxidase subunit 2